MPKLSSFIICNEHPFEEIGDNHLLHYENKFKKIDNQMGVMLLLNHLLHYENKFKKFG